MIRKPLNFIYLIILILLVSCESEKKQVFTIAAASNLQFVIEDLVEQYSRITGTECQIVISSSGKLTAQILEGAPFDLFLSADMKYPTELYREGLTISEPYTYAYGSLVLWSVKESQVMDMDHLRAKDLDFVALGNPKTAPYGIAAMSVINNLGLQDRLREKLVFGESIGQTNQFIISGAADLGFTSKSVVLSDKMKDKGAWIEIDRSLYDPIAQGMVLLTGRIQFREHAIKFKDFLLSEEGKVILHKFGYHTELK
ncbi:molybdate ABC transporter substrate-binding protein [Lutimonas zeaxanthinifaciens]|uniref:molybdate ABC transporter substrate-binding protein n=1 Tax=Lutimonas zeaxanthinifaciens TaxID=3060215 RepID=UPI00265CF52D|nr:molybdate ABC transporter substrate-binding protein [Lutimonas sp. YSD2104]WKK65310.1 molybdate ABC transporter substrate-binding protein [Lutimonas sp. YSD2104]